MSRPLRSTLPWALAVLVAGGVLAPPALAAEDAEAAGVLRRVRPSIVTLRSVEGATVGIVLRADGLILTGSFAAASPAPLRVVVEGSGKAVTLRKAEVVGFHPRLDLALIRVDAKEQKVALTPATVSRTPGTPGQRVYAIGAASEGEGGPVLSAAGGILSGVDREVDGARYYQLDAPLTAGHAGGPMVDRAGRVLGIVAFQFAELEAVTFAIPLHDVDPAAFVPATARRAESERSREFLAAGERFGRNAELAKRLEGPGSRNWVLSTAYAMLAYRMALALAPGEAGIYHNVGMLLRSLDADAAAVPYLMRSIQAGPWDADDGRSYRELGLALVKQGKGEPARAAWREGVTKYPLASRIWEDLAIYHTLRRELAEAMHAAAVALFVPERDTRVTVLNDIRAFARGALPPAVRADVEGRTTVDALREELDRMVASSNRARAGRQLYVTGAFRDLVHTLGGPPVAGAERRIPQEPLRPLDR